MNVKYIEKDYKIIRTRYHGLRVTHQWLKLAFIL